MEGWKEELSSRPPPTLCPGRSLEVRAVWGLPVSLEQRDPQGQWGAKTRLGLRAGQRSG